MNLHGENDVREDIELGDPHSFPINDDSTTELYDARVNSQRCAKMFVVAFITLSGFFCLLFWPLVEGIGSPCPKQPPQDSPFTASIDRIKVVESAHVWSKARKPYAGRRFAAVVVSGSPGAINGRLPVFLEKWNAAWPNLHFHVQFGARNRQSQRGSGILIAFITAIRKVLLNAAQSPLAQSSSSGKFDYLLLFEDDAVPFNGTTWPNVQDNDLDLRLQMLEEQDGAGMLLGAHDVRGFNKSISKLADPFGVTPACGAWGAYAMVIPWREVEGVLKIFEDSLATDGSELGPDNIIWTYWNKNGSCLHKGHISTPLLVDHLPGFSQTWNKMRADTWMGKRDWWNYSEASKQQ